MKPTKLNLSLLILILAGLFTLNSCEVSDNDPCDGTSISEIHMDIRQRIQVFDAAGLPVVGASVEVQFTKHPCGAVAKGHFTFYGYTDANGYYESPIVGYNLRNDKDQIWFYSNVWSQGYGRESYEQLVNVDEIKHKGSYFAANVIYEFDE